MDTTTLARCVLRHKGARPTAQTGLICDACLADIRDMLGDLGALWLEMPYSGLPLARAGGDNPEVKPPKHGHSGEPVNLTGLALRLPDTRPLGSVSINARRNGQRLESNGVEIPPMPAVLSSWCRTVSLGRNTSVDVSTVTVMIDALRHHLVWIAEQGWVVSFEADLRSCRRALAAATNQPARRRPICACPDCGGPVWTDQDRRVNDLLIRNKPISEPLPGRLDLAECDRCGKTWDGWPAMTILGRMVEQAAAESRSA